MLFENKGTYCAVDLYIGHEELVIIPEFHNGLPVLEINSRAFIGNCSIEKVIIPKNLQRIGENAFTDCFNLKQITYKEAEDNDEISTFPPSLTVFGDYAFSGSGLTAIVFESEIVALGEDAFSHCTSLQFVIGRNVESARFSSGAFFFSFRLTHVFFPKLIKCVLPIYMFGCCSHLNKVEFLNISKIEEFCFRDCSALTTVTNISEETVIERSAFNQCKMLNKELKKKVHQNIWDTKRDAFARHLKIKKEKTVTNTDMEV